MSSYTRNCLSFTKIEKNDIIILEESANNFQYSCSSVLPTLDHYFPEEKKSSSVVRECSHSPTRVTPHPEISAFGREPSFAMAPTRDPFVRLLKSRGTGLGRSIQTRYLIFLLFMFIEWRHYGLHGENCCFMKLLTYGLV